MKQAYPMRQTTAAVAIGASLSLAAFGASAAEIARGQSENGARDSGPAYSEKVAEVNPSMQRLTGALSSYSLPNYDGPVQWGYRNNNHTSESVVFLTTLATLLGGAGFGLVSLFNRPESNKQFLASCLVGATIVGVPTGILMSEAASATSVISFPTVVNDMSASSSPYYSKVKSGKVSHEVGPFFAQTVSIPECHIPLASGHKGAPFIAGQKIVASFVINTADGTIQSWTAVPGHR